MLHQKISAILCCLLLLFGTAACRDGRVTATGFALNTVISVSLYDGDEQTAAGLLARAAEWEKVFSRKIPGSDTDRINTSGGKPVQVSRETAELLLLAKQMYELSGGLFDITVAPLSDLWDFNGVPRVPEKEELRQALTRVGQEQLTLSGDTVTLAENARIDLGALAKGYIGDLLAEELKEKGKTRGMVNLGGNVTVFGGQEQPFRIAVQRPFGEAGEYACTLSVTEGSVVTSGVYERGFGQGDAWYHHLLDPRTGYPMDNGLWSVTVITDTGARGDALSTALFLMGQEAGLSLAEALPDTEAIFIRSDGTAVMTSGLSEGTDRVSVTDPPFSEVFYEFTKKDADK